MLSFLGFVLPEHFDFIFCIKAICFLAYLIRSSFDSVSSCENVKTFTFHANLKG